MYTVYDESGEAVGGSPDLDDWLRKHADEVRGHIEDADGNRVYPEEA